MKLKGIQSSDNLTKFRNDVRAHQEDTGVSREEAKRDVILYNLQEYANDGTISWTELEDLSKKYGESVKKVKK